jgi:hypothetical protein
MWLIWRASRPILPRPLHGLVAMDARHLLNFIVIREHVIRISF